MTLEHIERAGDFAVCLYCRAVLSDWDKPPRDCECPGKAAAESRDTYFAMLRDADGMLREKREHIERLRAGKVTDLDIASCALTRGWLPPEDARRSAERWGEVAKENRELWARIKGLEAGK